MALLHLTPRLKRSGTIQWEVATESVEKPPDRPRRSSRWRGLTTWGKAKEILKGKSRGANLLVLGVFLLVMSGVSDALSRTSGIPTPVGDSLRTFAFLAFIWGGMMYMRGD